MTVDGGRIAALSYELEDAVALLKAGREHLGQMRPSEAGVVLALLAAGSEKLLKLTLGLTDRDETGVWTTKRAMLGWSHRIAELDEHVLHRLEARTHLSPAEPYIKAVLARAAHDPIRRELFAALQAYASSGRFAHLDQLAGSSQETPSPRERWDSLKNDLVQAHPELLARMVDLQEDFEQAQADLAALIDEALQWWQLAIFRAWQHGLAGPEARGWAAQLTVPEPPGLSLPD